MTAEPIKVSGGDVARMDYAMYSSGGGGGGGLETHVPPPRVVENEEEIVMDGEDENENEAVAPSMAWNGLNRQKWSTTTLTIEIMLTELLTFFCNVALRQEVIVVGMKAIIRFDLY
ncbi:hypothetical protein PanWU01x14_031570 [Parasponia andersonii]|uniref:Uncharacterized protein n=1 Tax=Parasponia andersonii TaxID=3476 RepID=A0A2P5DU95_PARAD|nr:hypothetical protein PanWU01x14_031570 [Parasponia andersonii]